MSDILSEHIDRLSRTARAIKSTIATPTNASFAGPFTRAVLNTHLGNLIRDIDPSELGLFTLTSLVPVHGHQDSEPEITRVEFTGATPLRKPRLKEKEKEAEPEVFANAALKYIDR